jgi:hypothetical protein
MLLDSAFQYYLLNFETEKTFFSTIFCLSFLQDEKASIINNKVKTFNTDVSVRQHTQTYQKPITISQPPKATYSFSAIYFAV